MLSEFSKITSAASSARSTSTTVTTVTNENLSQSSSVLDTPTITNIVFSAIDGVQTGVPTRTTSTLTPTTLKNIEHLFEAESVNPPVAHTNQAGFVPPTLEDNSETSAPVNSTTIISVDSKSWGGGVTTLTTITPVPVSSLSVSQPSDNAKSSRNAMPVTRVVRTAQRRSGGRRPQMDDSLSPEEEERRLIRRERNKQAAARCRKRRLDQTMQLEEETESLEGRREALQKEIHNLQQQREELEFLLAAHKNSCKISAKVSMSEVLIKEEPIEFDKYGSPMIPLQLKSTNIAANKPSRPTTLNIRTSGISDLGVSIETPSNALRGLGLNFDSMIEGGTGLTPIVMQPITPLTTPVTSTTQSSKCGSQSRAGPLEISSPDSHPPKLVSL